MNICLWYFMVCIDVCRAIRKRNVFTTGGFKVRIEIEICKYIYLKFPFFEISSRSQWILFYYIERKTLEFFLCFSNRIWKCQVKKVHFRIHWQTSVLNHCDEPVHPLPDPWVNVPKSNNLFALFIRNMLYCRSVNCRKM